MAGKKAISKVGQERVSAKISKLHHEEPDKSHEQHVAMALSMEREGRLGPRGAYKRKGKK